MPWPTPQDYNEAIQSPHLAFEDPALKAGTPELTALGLPRPITGNFASVYRMRCAGSDLAVRCFWREFADLQDRYAAISHHLQTAGLPYTVGFVYLPRGIRVRSQWYPVLKMEWVQGQLLNEYIEAHLHERSALLDLAGRWLRMVVALRQAGVAHGDLQHGNVLVVGGELKLVDYDGMFVPGLAGRSSHELGHPNYQHPLRGGAHFGPTIDRFSALVVYLSLLALSAEPSLWGRANGGDECLLLRKADFDLNGRSPTLQLVEQSGDVQVRRLVQELRAGLAREPAQLPALEEVIGSETGRRSPARWLPQRIGAWRWGAVPGELPSRSESAAAGTGPPAWVREAMARPQDEGQLFTSSLAVPRRWIAASGLLAACWQMLLVVGAVPVALSALAVPLLLVLVDALVLLVCLRRDPGVMARRCLARQEREQLRRLRWMNREVRRREERKIRLCAGYDRSMNRGAAHKKRLMEQERAAGERALSPVLELLQQLERNEAEVDRQERDALERALRALQERHVGERLRKASLRSASIPGVGLYQKARLWLRGVRSAADVGSARAEALKRLEREPMVAVVAWHASVLGQARRSKPHRLPPAIERRVAARYRKRRDRLQRRRRGLVARQTLISTVLTDLYAAKYAGIERALARAAQERFERCCQLDREIAEVRTEEPLRQRELARVQRELEAFRGLTFRRYTVEVLRGLRAWRGL